MANPRICSIPECDKPVRVKSRGWCNAHWIRWSRYGDPSHGQYPRDAALKFIYETAIHHENPDECLVWPYNKTGDGYGRVGVNGKRLGAHRLVCEAIHGAPPTLKHEAAHSCGKGHLGCVNPHHLMKIVATARHPVSNGASKNDDAQHQRQARQGWRRLQKHVT